MCQERKNSWKTENLCKFTTLHSLFTSFTHNELYWWMNKGSKMQLSKNRQMWNWNPGTLFPVQILEPWILYSLLKTKNQREACQGRRTGEVVWAPLQDGHLLLEAKWGFLPLPCPQTSSQYRGGEGTNKRWKEIQSKKNPSRKAPAGKQPGEETGRAYNGSSREQSQGHTHGHQDAWDFPRREKLRRKAGTLISFWLHRKKKKKSLA